jgi:hypothetical protein
MFEGNNEGFVRNKNIKSELQNVIPQDKVKQESKKFNKTTPMTNKSVTDKSPVPTELARNPRRG